MLAVIALVYLLRQQPHAATAGSLIIVGITALAGMAAHWRAGRVRVAQGIVFGVLGVAGSYAGTRLSASIRPDVLLALFAGRLAGVQARAGVGDHLDELGMEGMDRPGNLGGPTTWEDAGS
jgi:uncharacterized membrane protein YfcA